MFGLSAGIVIFQIFSLIIKLKNLKAIIQLGIFVACWFSTALCFTGLAYVANIPAPLQAKDGFEQDIRIHQAKEQLLGPSALILSINSSQSDSKILHGIPNLKELEEKHPELLQEYISKSPRWRIPADDTFYAKAGHLILIPQQENEMQYGSVHAAFRKIIQGERLPIDYIIAHPGKDIPNYPKGSSNSELTIPNLAIELSNHHYLMLSWRGIKTEENALRALNAAIEEIDGQFKNLRLKPTQKNLEQLLKGQTSILGDIPQLKLREHPIQFGYYQAELYANTREDGVLALNIKDARSKKTLRLITFNSQHTARENELLRHDIPQHLEAWEIRQEWNRINGIIDPELPLFVIKTEDKPNSFEVICEVQFIPSDSAKKTITLLRKHYLASSHVTEMNINEILSNKKDKNISKSPSKPAEMREKSPSSNKQSSSDQSIKQN